MDSHTTSDLPVNAAGFEVPTIQFSLLAPAPGTVSRQLFKAVYGAQNSYQDLQWVQLLIAAALDGGGAPFCLLHCDVPAREVWLYGDEGYFVGPGRPGTPTTALSNSLCSVSMPATKAAGLGCSLILTADILFKGTSPVPLSVFLRAKEKSAGDAAWAKISGRFLTESVPASHTRVEPSSGCSTEARFTITYEEPAGFGGAPGGWVQFLIAESPEAQGHPFCFVHFDKAARHLWMYSSDLGFFLGPMNAGQEDGQFESSACRVDVAGCSVVHGDGTLVLEVPVQLKAPMAGPKGLFLRSHDVLGRDSGWQRAGEWTIP
ncbi:MAG: hypothetical protein QM757_06975 [Paludibaculum sp.]